MQRPAFWTMSDPDLNQQFRRGYRWADPPGAGRRTPGPGGGRSAVSENLGGNRAKNTARPAKSQARLAAERLFAPDGSV